MHDFLLAKQIIDDLKKIAKDKGLNKISGAKIEIGQIALAHDGFDEHIEDISVENLVFGLESIAKGTIAEGAEFKITKTKGENYNIVSIEGDK